MSRFEMIIKGDNRLSSEERYLVLALYIEVVLYQNEIVNVKVSTLISDFGATTKVVKNVVEYLVKKKNIKLVNLPSKARQLIFSQDDIATLVEEWTKLPSWKQDSILGLFEPEKRKILIPKKIKILIPKKIKGSSSNVGALRNSNLLLLYILILHSNDVGLVKKLSHKSIRFMMGGISEDRLKSQIMTLKKTNYLLNSVGGASGKYLFGKRSGVIFLNLMKIQQPSFSLDDGSEIEVNGIELKNSLFPSLAIMLIGSFCHKNNCDYTYKKMGLRLSIRDKLVDDASNITPILFNSIFDGRTDVLLQLEIEKLVSKLLSNFGGVNEKELNEFINKLCKVNDLFSDKYKIQKEYNNELKAFETIIKEIVINIASTVINCLKLEPSIVNGKHLIVHPHELEFSTLSSMRSKFYIVSRLSDDSLALSLIEYSYVVMYKESKCINRKNGWKLKVKRYT
ncbi:hypothetical protein ACU5EH_10055 [Aliivibrio salmonicida]|uniref:hypothetical protein n=1 Tax=Aliivibrio salmonicida TaxID=40269 RepID=UPI00406D3F2C